MDIAAVLNEQSILLGIKGQNKYQAIEELVDVLHRNGQLDDRDAVLETVLEREKYLSTGLENGLAVPHGKTNGVSQLIMAFGRSDSGIDFDSLDGKLTHNVCLLLSPKDNSGPHIRALAQITKLLRLPHIRNRLMTAQQAGDILDILNDGGDSE